MAEISLGRAVEAVALTIPSPCTQTKRLAMMNAARSCGMIIATTITYPMAAVSAYELYPNEDRYTLVLDFGAQALRAYTISTTRDGEHVIRNLMSLAEFGGNQITDKIIEELSAQFQGPTIDDSFEDSVSDLNNVREVCEIIKSELSVSDDACVRIQVDAMWHNVSCNRTWLECLLSNFALKLDEVLNYLLVENTCQDVVVMGGVSNCHIVKSLLEKHLSGRSVLDTIPPTVVGAIGAIFKGQEMWEKVKPKPNNIVSTQTVYVANLDEDGEISVGEAEDHVVYADGGKALFRRPLQDSELEEAVTVAVALKESYEEKKEIKRISTELRNTCLQLLNQAKKLNKENKITDYDKSLIVEKCNLTIYWLFRAKEPELNALRDKLDEVNIYCNFIISLN